MVIVPSGSNPVGSVSVRRPVDDDAGAAVLDGRVVHLDGSAATRTVLCGTSARVDSCSAVLENLLRAEHVWSQLRRDELKSSKYGSAY